MQRLRVLHGRLSQQGGQAEAFHPGSGAGGSRRTGGLMKVDPKTLIQDCHFNLCIQCGTCTGGCPVKERSPLNMRRLVRETTLNANFPQILKRPELWACTTCSTCSLRCPAGVKNVEMIMGIRNILTRQGEVPRRSGMPLNRPFFTEIHGDGSGTGGQTGQRT